MGLFIHLFISLFFFSFMENIVSHLVPFPFDFGSLIFIFYESSVKSNIKVLKFKEYLYYLLHYP